MLFLPILFMYGVFIEAAHLPRLKRSVDLSKYPGCNGTVHTIHGKEGIITSPGYPAPYPHGVTCIHKIIGQPGTRLRLQYTFMAIQDKDCWDSVKIFDDEIHSQTPMALHCQLYTPTTVYITQGHTATVHFKSDFPHTSLGFVLTFQTVPLDNFTSDTTTQMTGESTITDTETTSSGTSSTPSTTISNTASLTPSSSISSTKSSTPSTTISSSKSSTPSTTISSTKSSTPSTTISSTKSSTTGSSISSTKSSTPSPTISITKSSTPSTSIYSTASSTPSTTTSSTPSTSYTTESTVSVCTSAYYYELTSQRGILQSPNYPLPYPSNSHCKWKIIAPSNQHIRLTARTFDLEQTDKCLYDYFTLRSSPNSWDQIANYCGLLVKPQNIYMASSQAYMEFRSDSTVNANGFSIEYEKIDLCQNPMVIQEPFGTLGTPGYIWDGSGKYDNNLNCAWKFEANPDQIVVLSILRLDIELYSPSACDTDALKIYDGSSSSDSLIIQICNTGVEDFQFKSTTNSMYMVFTTDSSLTYNGFEFSWTFAGRDDSDTTIISNGEGCSGSTRMLTGDSGSLSSPLTSSGKYPPNTRCTYSITVDANYDATLLFSTFDLEDESFCGRDWVKVYDGTSSLGTLMGTFCGKNPPAAITSTSHSFYIEFHSDSTVGGTGFTATYGAKDEVDLNACGIPHIEPSDPSGNVKIVGGVEAVAHSHPWMALIWVNVRGNYLPNCGASIIDNQWILTAAHCTDDWAAGDMLISVGDHDQRTTNEVPQTAVAVAEIVQHPNYDNDTLDNDISLIRLSSPLTYNFGVRRICLRADDVPVGEACWIAGWGTSEATADNKYRLNQGKVVTIDTSTCNRADWLNGHVTDNMFCAGYAEGGIDTCQGDSGGPLVCERDGVYTQYGIVSFGFGCADKKRPGVYTRLYNYIDWINQKTGNII